MSLQERREKYRESLRQDILDAARELFARNGYEQTSIRAIADKVGCSPGILYHYFEDKPAVMAQLVRETFARLHEGLTAMTQDSAPPIDNLRRGLRKYIEFGIEHPHHYAILFSKPAPEHPDAAAIKQAYHDDGSRCFDCLRTMVGHAINGGQLRPELNDKEEIAQALWASIHGMVSITTTAKGFPFIERTRLIERQVDILIAGIRR